MDNKLFWIGIELIIAAVVYGVAVKVLFWQIPRRYHIVPGILVAFVGALIGEGLFTRLLGDGRQALVIGAIVGAFTLIFVAVKVGTPGSVVLTIETELGSQYSAETKKKGHKLPFVWPYHFNIDYEGTVIFELTGKEGTEVKIQFEPDNTPFGLDTTGKPRTTFVGRVPGRILAFPAVVPSRGGYKIFVKYPGTNDFVVVDPTWDLPR